MSKAPKLYTFVNEPRGSVLGARIRVAGTSSERRKGLLTADGLEGGAGLWIVPCEAIHTFGMKFAIDAVFLDKGMRVRKLRRNLTPYRISMCLSAHSVLELPAGAIESSGTEVGDVLALSQGAV